MVTTSFPVHPKQYSTDSSYCATLEKIFFYAFYHFVNISGVTSELVIFFVGITGIPEPLAWFLPFLL